MATLGGTDPGLRSLGHFGTELQSKNQRKLVFYGPLAYFLVQKSPKMSRVGRKNALLRRFSTVSRFQYVLQVWKHDPSPLMWPCRVFFILWHFALKRPLVAENGDLKLKCTHLSLAYLNSYQKSFFYELAIGCKTYKCCVENFFIRCSEVWFPKSEKAFHSSCSSIPWLGRGPRTNYWQKRLWQLSWTKPRCPDANLAATRVAGVLSLVWL